MEFGEAIRTCLRKYATFSGRASRSEFWYFQLFVTVVFILPSIAVGSRRLHDGDKTGWLQLIGLTVIGLIPLIVWWATRGSLGDNRYGADPIRSASQREVVTSP